jgi:Zn-dependent protease with chaperone function
MAAARPRLRQSFGLAVALGTGGLLASAAAVGAAIGSFHHSSARAATLNVLALHFSYPRVNLAAGMLLALAVVGLAAISIAIRASWRQRQAHRGFLGHLAVVGPLAGRPDVTVIADRRPQAFCAGYLRPSVYISRGTLELLTEPELDAVLAHEHHHSRARDPLRFACARILSQALFFVPALRSLCNRDADLAEVSADRAAVEASGGRKAPLAAALLAFDERGATGTGGISSERIDSLLGEPLRGGLPWRSAAASAGLLCVIGLTIWRVGEIASAHATLSLPILSAQPCLAVTLMALVCGVRSVRRRNTAGRVARRQRNFGWKLAPRP